jgi:hypothetical protein
MDDTETATGPRFAAFGVIVAIVAIPVGLLSWLAGYGFLMWVAVVAVIVAATMIGLGFRQWRADVER